MLFHRIQPDPVHAVECTVPRPRATISQTSRQKIKINCPSQSHFPATTRDNIHFDCLAVYPPHGRQKTLNMSEQSTILLAGGGTGGHLYPGVSVAQALQRLLPNVKPLFLCTNRPVDKAILEPTHFEFVPQPIVPPVRTVTGLLKFWKSWRETKDLIRRVLVERKAIAVLGLGGYAAGVAVKLGASAGLPAAILNPDVIPGKANQYLLKYVKVACCQFQATTEHASAADRPKLRMTGCPVRTEMTPLPPRAQAAQRLGLDPALRTFVITGASQGAKSVNEAILAALPDLNLQGWQILHLAGRDHATTVLKAYREKAQPARVIDFTPEMADVWAVADLALCRGGGSTCAELIACGIPSILMPYPFHKDMHQRANAKVLADAGAAVLLDDLKQSLKNARQLTPLLSPLLHDAPRRQAMAAAAKSLGRPDAADAVAKVLLELTSSTMPTEPVAGHS